MSRTKDAVIDHLNAENEQDMCECCHEVSEPGERFPQADCVSPAELHQEAPYESQQF
jgi:hypothetical protein